MKVAIMILAHKNIQQVIRFIRQFDDSLFDVYLHIDRKLTLTEEDLNQLKEISNLEMIPERERVSITWGDRSMLEAERKIMHLASKKEHFFYLMLSGQDLLIKDSDDLYDFLLQNKDFNFNELIDENLIPAFRKRNEIHYPIRATLKESTLSRNLLKLLTGGRKHTFFFFKTKFSKQYDFHFGSSWFAYNQKMVDFILQFEKEHPDFYEGFKHSLNPDECYYQTILFASPYVDTIKNKNLTYIDWSEKGSSPKVLRLEDKDKVLSSSFYLARKFDMTIDEEIINQLLFK